MPRIDISNEDANSVLWRYLRLRHDIGSYCFGWRFEDDLIAFSYEQEPKAALGCDA